MSAVAGGPKLDAPILTPDRRLRVFVSSTLEELAAEREAVRNTIASMHLAPVMFELGARPHPPRDLYQAYLRQSDVFVGIYWQNYGWLVPGEGVSGLEDEYVLSAGMPQLLYVREPAPGRDPRLSGLIDRFISHGRSAFKIFATAEELGALVANDLAVMVTERFSAGARAVEPAAPSRRRLGGVSALLVTDLGDAGAQAPPWEVPEGEAAHRRLAECLRRVVSGRAQVLDLGDALLAVFDVPSEAVHAGTRLQRAAARDPLVSSAAPSGVRVGIHLAESVQAEQNYFGVSLVGARRLCQAAAPGQILVTDVVRAIAGPRVAEEIRAAKAPAGRDVPGGTPYEVVWQRAAARPCPPPPELDTPPDRGVFVGRGQEMKQLLARWEPAAAGSRQFMCVAGEPGIGKTRLVAEFAADLHRQGATVLWGRSSEEVLVPYQPFVQAIQHYVTTCPGEDLREQLGGSAALIARLVPALRDRIPDLPDPPADEPESERYRLFDAISSFLTTMSAAAPVLLVLDDLQWADRASLLLTSHVMHDARPASLLILATYRDTEGTQTEQLTDLFADVRRDHAFVPVHLGGLLRDDVPALVESLAGWKPAAGLAAELVAGTQGNPFFISEVVRHLQEAGVGRDMPASGAAVSFDKLGVPEGVREMVRRRVHRLSDRAAAALRTASAVGFTFGLELLAQVMNTDELELTTVLDEAVAARLIVEVPGNCDEYAFPHALIRYALYGGQSAATRAALHARIGKALEALHAGDLTMHLPELVRHFSRASARHRGKVAAYGRSAGELALSMLAYEDAVSSLRAALSASGAITPENRKDHARLLLTLGTALTRSGEAEQAREALLEAAQLAKAGDDRETLAEAALGYGGVAGFGGVWITFGEVDRVLVGLLEDALAAHPEEHEVRARLLARLAQALYWTADRARMLSLSGEALDMARRLGHPRALGQALDSRHVALWDCDHLDERQELAEEMLALGEDLGDRDIRLEAYGWLITDALERGRMDLVDRYVAAHVELSEELRQPYHLWYSRVAQAMQAQVEGRYDDLERLLGEAWEHGEKSHAENARQCYLLQSLVLQDARGQTREPGAAAGLEEFAAKSPLWGWWAALAYVSAQAGEAGEARHAVDRITKQGIHSLPRDCIWLSMAALTGEVVSRLGDRQQAEQLYALLLPYEDLVCCVGAGVLSLGPVARYLGVLARAIGDSDGSLEHLEHARRRAAQMRSTPEVVTAGIETAKTLRSRGREGDDSRAREILAASWDAAQAARLPRLLRELRDLGAQPHARGMPGTAPAG